MSDDCHISIVPESAGAAPTIRSELGKTPSISLDTGATPASVEEAGGTAVLTGESGVVVSTIADDAARAVSVTQDSGVSTGQVIESSDTTIIGNPPPLGIPSDETSDFDTPVEDVQEPTASDTVREFFVDFDTVSHFLSSGASLTRRLDAISLDYLTAYSIGPIADGDASGGTRARVWRARAVNDETSGTGQIFIANSNDSNTAWINEVLLFSYVGTAREIDLAFEQAARPVVTLEIAGRINLYWFDPTQSDFVVTDFDDGRNPRVLLDAPNDTANSDVLLFYIRDASDRVVYRQQRDRYATRYDSPLVNVGSKFLEEVIRATDNRVAIIASVRDVAAGQYSLQRRETTLYPYISDIDAGDADWAILAGVLTSIIIDHLLFDIDKIDTIWSIRAGTNNVVLINHVLFDIDKLDAVWAIQSGSNIVVVITHTMFDIDKLDAVWTIQSGTNVVIVITHTLFDIDQLDAAWSIQGGTLVAA